MAKAHIAFGKVSWNGNTNIQINSQNSLRASPLARSPEQVKLDSGKWKLWKNLFE
jgi:hypothetical protein